MSSSSQLQRNLLVTLFVALLPLTAWAGSVPTKAIEIQLEAEVKVGGEQVVLGDVATIYAKSLHDFKALSGLVISKIPDDQAEVKLPASYLEARVRAALPEGVEFTLRAPREIVFKLARLGLTSQDFANEVIRLARVSGKAPASTELEVLPLTGMEQLKGYSLASARIEPSAEMDKWKGDLAFKVFRTDGASDAPVWVKAKVRWFQRAWIATRQVGFGESPDPALFTEGRIETTNLREEPVAASREELANIFKGSRVKRSLAANGALLPSALERRPDAAAGSSLRVVFVSEGGVRVSADGALVGPASIGADVKAKLRSSRKIVTGKLVSQGVVEVSL